MKIKIKYMVWFIILFMTEVIIALFIKDKIIRPYVGDILVVILMYTFIKAFIQRPIAYLPLYLFLFASMVEVIQYFHILNLIHLQNNKVVSTIAGSSFDIKDIICYLVGSIISFVWDKRAAS